MSSVGTTSSSSAHSAAHQARLLAKYDTNKNGVLDPEERQAARAAKFAKKDTNKDGVISFDEFLAAIQAKFAKKGKTLDETKLAHLKQKFAALDSDGSGTISQTEFSAGGIGRYPALAAQ